MLTISNLKVKYRSSEVSIENISFDIKTGDRIAILGPSGCGKTTLLHVIAGLLTEKDASVEGRLEWHSNKRLIIRMVFQEARLLPWRTVEENIALGLEIEKLPAEVIRYKTADILALVELSEKAKNYPKELSIGMQQRVNFARALVCKPDLLLLDEPFSALDTGTKKRLQKDFLRILREKNITSIFVTHNMQEAVTMATKIIVLSKGPSTVLQILDNTQSDIEIEKLNYFDFLEME